MQKHLWKKDNYLGKIQYKLDNVQLVSFDIFDTLLFRMCEHPTDVFKEVGIEGVNKGILRHSLKGEEFKEIRIIAERKAREAFEKKFGHDEVNLKDIYDRMPKNIGNIPELMKTELEVEKRFCYLNPSMVSFIEHLKGNNIPIVLLSDMYLSSEQIKEVLIYNGFAINQIDSIWVSNEHQGGKSSGALFKKMIESYPSISVANIIHIGDNERADIDGAKQIGIQGVHYTVISKEMNIVFEAEKITYGVLLPEILSLRKLAENMTSSYTRDQKKWVHFGTTILGPFLTLFADWIVDLCIKEGKKEVYPLMREGALLTELIQRAAKQRGVELIVKPIYVSRISTQFAEIENVNKKTLDKIFNTRNFTIGYMFDLLGISQGKEVFAENANDFLQHTEKSVKSRVIDFLLSNDNKPKLETFIQYNRNLFVTYLLQTCKSVKDVVTVDIGFRGTMQKRIEIALASQGIDSKITHLLAIGTEYTRELLWDGIDIRGFVGNAGENLDIIEMIRQEPGPLEELMVAEDLGTTLGYELDKNQIVSPILAKNSNPKEEIALKKLTHQGIFLFQDLWFYFKQNKAETAMQIMNKKREICKIIHRMFSIPTYQEATLIGDLHHDDWYEGNKFYTLCGTADELIQELGVEKFLIRNSCELLNQKVSWAHAAVTKYEPGYFYTYFYNNEGSKHLKAMIYLIKCIKKEGIHEIVIYGAGEAGKTLLKAAKFYDIKIRYFVDQNEQLWGKEIDGIKIIPLDEAVREDEKVFAIGSLRYIEEIKETIHNRYRMNGKNVSIFSPDF